MGLTERHSVSSFYNDINPKACAWTRKLIAEGAIAPGHVECGSIYNLCPISTSSLTVTSSPESPVGREPSTLQAGLELDLFGQPLFPAKAFHAQETSSDLPTNAVNSGTLSTRSSASISLSSFLESRLKRQFDSVGSIEYSQIWKQKVTPAGLPYWAHTARARRTSDSEFTGWPSVTTCSGGANSNRENRSESGGPNLQEIAATAPWNSPQARDHFPAHRADYIAEKKAEGHGMGNLNDQAMLTPWRTPTAMDGNRGSEPPRPHDTGIALSQQVLFNPWSSPSARDHKDSPGMATTGINPDGSIRNRTDQLPRQAVLIIGEISQSSTAPTVKPDESRGALNPFFSMYLMGYPVSWAMTGIRALLDLKKK